MDFKQLEAFVQVVKEGSFSKAAQKMFLSQPTVSAHIASLEKELGVQLLVRSTKTIYPTKEGEKLLGYAQNILAIRQQATYAVSGDGLQLEGKVDILSSSVPAQYLLPQVLAAFYKQHPKVTVGVYSATSQGVVERLDGWDYDFGIVGAPVASKKFDSHPFYKDRLVLVGPKGGLEQNMSPEELKGYLLSRPFVLMEDGSGTRKGVDRLLAGWGLNTDHLRVAAIFSDNHSVIHSVSQGLGLSFVSQRAAAFYAELGLIDTYSLEGLDSHRYFSVIHLKEVTLSPLVKELTQFIQDFYKDSSPLGRDS